MDTRLLARLLDAARTVVPVGAITATAAHSQHARSAGGAAIVQGEVAEPLQDGRFRVLIEGKPLLLRLPADFRTGDRVQFRVSEHAPRLQLVPDATRTAIPAAALSRVGQLLGTLWSSTAATPQRQALPVVTAPTAAPAELTGPLARAIESSGLFYESHQARWIEGDYPLARLREEPQAGAALRRDSAAASPAPQAQAAGHAPASAISAKLPTLVRTPESSAESVSTLAAAAPREDPARAALPEIAAKETLPLVRQQLDTLEHRALNWLGEIWPGQTMRWEIAEHNRGQDAPDQRTDWDTRFALTLPRLGEVGAALVLTSHGVDITLSAHDHAATRALAEALPDLRRALAAAGIKATGIDVRQDDAPA